VSGEEKRETAEGRKEGRKRKRKRERVIVLRSRAKIAEQRPRIACVGHLRALAPERREKGERKKRRRGRKED